MAVYEFRGRRIPKFKPGTMVRVKEESSSPYHGLAGTWIEAAFLIDRAASLIVQPPGERRRKWRR